MDMMAGRHLERRRVVLWEIRNERKERGSMVVFSRAYLGSGTAYT